MRAAAVPHGDDRVAVAPDDQRGHLGGEVEPVPGEDALAHGPDDRAQRRQEGRAGPALRQAGHPAPDLGEVGLDADPGEAEHRPEHLADGPRGVADARDDELRAGQGGAAQQRVHGAAQAAAGDEDEPLGVLREEVGELHRDAAPERVADERRPLVAEREQQVARRGGQRADRVVRRRASRAPWPGRSGAITVQCRARLGITASQFSLQPAMPWISSRTGPSPSSR